MIKKMIPVILSVMLCLSFSAYAYDDTDMGFAEDEGRLTETLNEYFFYPENTILVENKEVFTDPSYRYLHAGSDLYVPIFVYPDGSGKAVQASDKLIKTDNVTVSSKATLGQQYVGETTIIDGKKLKIKSVGAGAYVHIPLGTNYAKTGKSNIIIKLVLSVNDVTYERTEVTLRCQIKNRVTEIDKNSVYGAKTPAEFHADKKYSGEVTFDFGGNIKYTAKVKADNTYYLNLSKTANTAIKEMYADAYLEFYSFLGDHDTFRSTGTLEIPVTRSKFSRKGASPALYVYRIDGNNLTALGAGSVGFATKTDKLVIYTNKLDSYVLSNTPLLKQIAGGQDENILRSGYATTLDQ